MTASNREALRKKAMFAARSVTLAAFVACVPGGKTDEDSDVGVDDSDTLADTEPGESDTTETDAVESGETDVGETDPVESDPPETDVADAAPDCAALGLDFTACCDTMRDWCDDRFAADSQAYNECVFGKDFSGSTGCIPWGPPVPPRARLA